MGNVGSEQRFKYGPLGDSVNLASRLQGATKQLGVRCIASRETVHAAEYWDSARRLTKLSVVGIERSVDIYEVPSDPSDSTWRQLKQEYESSLSDYESLDFHRAITALKDLTEEFPDDRPSQDLLVRAIKASQEDQDGFSSILTLTTK